VKVKAVGTAIAVRHVSLQDPQASSAESFAKQLQQAAGQGRRPRRPAGRPGGAGGGRGTGNGLDEMDDDVPRTQSAEDRQLTEALRRSADDGRPYFVDLGAQSSQWERPGSSLERTTTATTTAELMRTMTAANRQTARATQLALQEMSAANGDGGGDTPRAAAAATGTGGDVEPEPEPAADDPAAHLRELRGRLDAYEEQRHELEGRGFSTAGVVEQEIEGLRAEIRWPIPPPRPISCPARCHLRAHTLPEHLCSTTH
jgi:hypothetical protein